MYCISLVINYISLNRKFSVKILLNYSITMFIHYIRPIHFLLIFFLNVP